MKNKKIFLVLSNFFIVLLVFLFLGNSVLAGKEKALTGMKTTAGTLYDVTSTDTPAVIIGKIIAAALSFLGVIFFILMIYGGFIWMTARGNDQEAQKAKDLITNAIIGLVIVLAAYAITLFVASSLGSGAATPVAPGP